jgi:hypothetical protein
VAPDPAPASVGAALPFPPPWLLLDGAGRDNPGADQRDPDVRAGAPIDVRTVSGHCARANRIRTYALAALAAEQGGIEAGARERTAFRRMTLEAINLDNTTTILSSVDHFNFKRHINYIYAGDVAPCCRLGRCCTGSASTTTRPRMPATPILCVGRIRRVEPG